MTPLFEKSIETLELPRVLALLAEEAATEEGRERCLALRPLSVPGDVSRLQKQTSAAFDLLVKHGTPSLSGIRPVAAALQRAPPVRPECPGVRLRRGRGENRAGRLL